MLTERQAKELANHWIRAWNSHDLDEIMSHYEEDAVLVSPLALTALHIPSGTVAGKQALRAYFSKGLELFPNLRFELLDVTWGVNSLVLYYENQKGVRAGEFMEMGPAGKISRVFAHYNG